jgi:hypothetical protein
MSSSPARHGMIASRAARIASTTLAETFAGVSIKTQSTLRRLAFFKTSSSSRLMVLIGSACSWRRPFHSVNDACGSSSINRQRCLALCACSARCAANVLFPDPPFRDANARTCIRHQPRMPRMGVIVAFQIIRAMSNLRASREHRVYVKVMDLSQTSKKRYSDTPPLHFAPQRRRGRFLFGSITILIWKTAEAQSVDVRLCPARAKQSARDRTVRSCGSDRHLRKASGR